MCSMRRTSNLMEKVENTIKVVVGCCVEERKDERENRESKVAGDLRESKWIQLFFWNIGFLLWAARERRKSGPGMTTM